MAGARRWQERVPDEPPAEDSSPATLALERIVHYEELIRFETRILEQMAELAGPLSDAAREEIEVSNVGPQRALIDEFRRRRDSWADRRDSAGGPSNPPPSGAK
ncbi:MAG TPA: hypothetical protein VIO86_04565 [Candidatus Dormibacteraeota bacterium]